MYISLAFINTIIKNVYQVFFDYIFDYIYVKNFYGIKITFIIIFMLTFPQKKCIIIGKNKRGVMQATAQTIYAIYALTNLATKNIPVKASEISKETGIPKRFLEITLLKLKSVELLDSKKGVNGGFVLKRSPSSITLYDIVSATEGSLNIFECKKYIGNNCSSLNILDSINAKFIETLKSITLEDILKTNNINITNFVI